MKFLNIKWSHSCWDSISLFIVHFGALISSSLSFFKCMCELTVLDISVAGVRQWNLVFRKQELSVNLLSIVIIVHSAVMWSRLWLYLLLVLISLYDKREQETCWNCSQYLWLLNQAVDISLTWIFPADILWGNISVKYDRVHERCHSTCGQHHVTWSEQAASVRRADISMPLRYRQGLTWETGTDGLLFRLLSEPWMAALILLMDTW